MALVNVSTYGITLRDWSLPVLRLHSTGSRLRNQPKMPPIVFAALESCNKIYFCLLRRLPTKREKKVLTSNQFLTSAESSEGYDCSYTIEIDYGFIDSLADAGNG